MSSQWGLIEVLGLKSDRFLRVNVIDLSEK